MPASFANLLRAGVQERRRDQREPERGRCRVRRGLCGCARQRRVVGQRTRRVSNSSRPATLRAGQGSAAISGARDAVVYWESCPEPDRQQGADLQIAIPSDATYAAYYTPGHARRIRRRPGVGGVRVLRRGCRTCSWAGRPGPTRLDALGEERNRPQQGPLRQAAQAARRGRSSTPATTSEAKALLSRAWAAAAIGVELATADYGVRFPPTIRSAGTSTGVVGCACGSWPGCCPSRPTRLLSSWHRWAPSWSARSGPRTPVRPRCTTSQMRHDRLLLYRQGSHHHGRAGADHSNGPAVLG